MRAIGIIAEYNPFHAGHAFHIAETRRAAGENCAIVCVMSGNFVQRGDFAVFGKHVRAEAAVRGGADLVIELQTPYALLSSAGFADAGVSLLDSSGVCDGISFGSESGDVSALARAAGVIASPESDRLIKEWLDKGLPYASAQQKAADALMGAQSEIFRTPNNLLGIEYLKTIAKSGSGLKPMTIRRSGGRHDSAAGLSSSAIRNELLGGGAEDRGRAEDCVSAEGRGGAEDRGRAEGSVNANGRGGAEGRGRAEDCVNADGLTGAGDRGSVTDCRVPPRCRELYDAEICAGRGPVSMKSCEIALLSRLRAVTCLTGLPGASEGLERRLLKYAASEATIDDILFKVKTKRYAMSRIRRMLLCACLGITAEDTAEPPPYIRVLAMNDAGTRLLKEMRAKAKLPIIIKPASVRKLSGRAVDLMRKESAATDIYALAYPLGSMRSGGQEWRISPAVCCAPHP